MRQTLTEIKTKVLALVLTITALMVGQSTAMATSKTVTYKITDINLSSGGSGYDIVFTRSGDAPFDTSAPTTYTAYVPKGSIENGESGYLSVMLADGFELHLQWSANSTVRFTNNCIYPSADGKYITYSVSHHETYHYVTHVEMSGNQGGNFFSQNYDSVWNCSASTSTRSSFGTLTITYTDVPLLSIFETAGTNTYNIKTKDDLRHLANYVNNGHNNCNGLTFLQTTDITFDNTANNYTPIGYAVRINKQKQPYCFDGTYDGQGYTISGIYVNRTGSDQYLDSYVGLFGYTDEHGAIKNIVLTGSTFVGKDYVGGIVGYNEGSYNNNCLVTNCRVGNNVTIKAGTDNAYNHGGIVGRNEGIVQGCLSGASVSKNGKSDSKAYGGIVGYNTSTIRDCFYTSNQVTADTNVGAIVGNNITTGGVINNYYTQGTIGGSNGNDVSGACRGYKVSLAENVTLKNPTESVYNLSGLTCISYRVGNNLNNNVLRYGGDIYCGAGQSLSFDYTGTIPEGQGVVYHSTAGTVTDNVLTMPEQDVKVTAALEYMYMDANGKTHTTNATQLFPNQTTFPGGTYYVGFNLTFNNNNLSFDGDVTLILGNGTMMDITPPYGEPGLYVKGNLTVYGQSLDAATAGTLRILGSSGYMSVDNAYTQHSGNVIINNASHRGLKAGSMTLNGGKLKVLNTNGKSVECQQDITVNGGILEATAPSFGLYSQYGHIALGWTRPTDRITATNYYSVYPIVTKTGQTFFNDPDTPDVVMNTVSNLQTINGKTLIPGLVIFDDDSAQPDGWKNQDLMYQVRGATLPVMLKGRTLYKDGKWNTLCLPFTLLKESLSATPLGGDGVTVMRLNKDSHLSGSVLTLNFSEYATYSANEPLIIRWDNTGINLTDPVFKGVGIMISNGDVTSNDKHVKFKGTYTPISFTEANPNVLLLGEDNTLFYPLPNAYLNSCRAYFELIDVNGVREIKLNFDDETTSLNEELRMKNEEFAAAAEWYSLDGRKLEKQPTKAGLYIYKGKKVAIK